MECPTKTLWYLKKYADLWFKWSVLLLKIQNDKYPSLNIMELFSLEFSKIYIIIIETASCVSRIPADFKCDSSSLPRIFIYYFHVIMSDALCMKEYVNDLTAIYCLMILYFNPIHPLHCWIPFVDNIIFHHQRKIMSYIYPNAIVIENN